MKIFQSNREAPGRNYADSGRLTELFPSLSFDPIAEEIVIWIPPL